MSSTPFGMLFATATAIPVIVWRVAPQYLIAKSVIVSGLLTYFLSFLAFMTWRVVLWPHFFSPIRHLPGPKGGSFWNGQFAKILADPSGEPQREWMETIPNDGLIYYRALFNAERIMVTSPKALAEVMTTRSYDFIKPPQVRAGLGRLLGVGVLLAEGDEHKRQRKSLNPAFAFRHVKEIYPIFWEKARETILKLDEAIKSPHKDPESGEEKAGNIVEVGKWASRSTLDIIGVAGFDQSFNAVQDPSSELYRTYQTVFRQDRGARIIGLLNILLPMWLVRLLPLKRNSEINDAVKVIRATCRDLIHKKKEKIAAGKDAGKDILAVALQSGQFDDEDLINQLMTFLAAGHETTASSMQWAVCLLCQHPDVQKKLREDLMKSNLPSIRDEGRTIASEDIDNIPYLNAVCSEVLRFMPPVPFTLRLAAKDTTILGQFVPKGTTVVLVPQAVNRNKELWGADANEFKPDRWLGSGKANSGGADSNYSFLTFLHGPRSCIGMSFAKAEFAVLLASWVLGFDTELEDPARKIESAGGVTQRPKGGLSVKITPVSTTA